MRLITGTSVLVVFLVTTALTAPAHGAGRFQIDDFRYLGAFRTPVFMGTADGTTVDLLSWCKGIDAYYPDGDPTGPADGYPGSLFGVGHGWVTPMFEIAIPAPVISDNIADLPVAQLLQTPHDVASSIEIAGDGLKGIEFLPAQPGMSGPKLHITVGQHYQYDRRPTHGWIDLDLSNPHTAGPWYVGRADQVNCLNVNEYVFTIPKEWADQYVGGRRLACGRYREGQVATGPSVIAYSPWEAGNPPPANTEISAVPLVLYRNLNVDDGMDGLCWADNWTGAAWLTNGEKMAVAIVGTKGFGNCWYGWQDGTTPEECAQWPGGCEANGYGGSNRGFYADSFRTVVLLYDPRDLAKVVRGQLTSWEPQPYAMLDITPQMIRPETTYEIGTGGVAYDDVHGLLYISERGGDESTHKDIIHVFSHKPALHVNNTPGNVDPNRQDIHGGGSIAVNGGTSGPSGALSVRVSVDRSAHVAAIQLSHASASTPRRVTVHDVSGRLVADLGTITGDRVDWDTRNVRAGVYFVRVRSGVEAATGKVVLVNR
jgi:hypothetical protein